MGSFNNWEDDEDSFYDWGSQFGASKVETESKKPIEVATKPEQQEETPPEEPVKVETPEEKPTPVENTEPAVEANTENTETPADATAPIEKRPVTREDLESLSETQRSYGEATAQMRDKIQQMIPLCKEGQLPKGMRTLIRMFGEISDVAIATRSLADFYLEAVKEQRYIVFKDSGLKSQANNILGIFKEQESQIQEVLAELEEMINNGEERVVLNLRTHTIKGKALFLRMLAEQQAQAYSKAIDSFHPDKGALPLLEKFAEKGDREVMNSIDNTLNLADTSMVLVEDAPEMLVALDHNDTDTIIRLQQKLIDHLFEK